MGQLFGKGSPSPPDPTQTANAQSQANIAQAIANARLNRVNQTTPWGSVSYTEGAPDANGIPSYSSQITLDPVQQQLLDAQRQQALQRQQIGQGLLNQAGSQMSKPLDFSQVHPVWAGYNQGGANGPRPPQVPPPAPPSQAAPTPQTPQTPQVPQIPPSPQAPQSPMTPAGPSAPGPLGTFGTGANPIARAPGVGGAAGMAGSAINPAGLGGSGAPGTAAQDQALKNAAMAQASTMPQSSMTAPQQPVDPRVRMMLAQLLRQQA